MDSSRTDLKIENMEMEAGILLHFLGGVGYRAAAICVVVNKRHEGTFLTDYRHHVFEAALIALRALRRCSGDR
jgi:uridine phosphorylase